MAEKRTVVMKPNDNVATALEDIAPDTDIIVKVGGREMPVHVISRIPFGHKLALVDIGRGQQVVKYGEVIGVATRDIKAGEHVHVHNLESCRGRGDKETM